MSNNRFVIEVSWEACNKVGGIYTVISTKAAKMKEALGENYFIVGPYFLDKAKGEFQETTPPDEFKTAFNALKQKGIYCHWGKWLIRGEPHVILVDFSGCYNQLNNIKTHLWQSFKIDSLRAAPDFNAPVLWAWCVGKVISQLKPVINNSDLIVHAHEWLSGATLLYLKEKEPQIKRIFTTHATVLGRSLASLNYPLYEEIETIDADKKAYELHIEAKHQIEKASAQNASVMTTVSEITALETEHFLKRKPDVLLPNGLNLSKSLTFEDISLSHRLQRDRMRKFLLYYFFPYYDFDLRQSLFYFISGRYEFHNKGVDIFIDALAQLNQMLKNDTGKAKTIVVFFWVPLGIKGIKGKLIEAREIFADVEQTLDDSKVTTGSNLLYNIIANKPISAKSLFEEDTLLKLERKLLKLKQPDGLPPLSTHDLIDENNLIIKHLREKGLVNKKEDKVKIIVYPSYLSGADGLLNLSYSECVQGSHLGVFPSYYEPWGYTPLETASLGVATITTDLAGFGRFIKPKLKQERYPGIFLLERYQKDYATSANDLSNLLYRYSHFSYYERVQNKIGGSNLARQADWDKLIQNYIKAYEKAS